MPTFLRPRKDGKGLSECSCPEELVGKGRCIHILDGNNKPLELSRMGRGLYQVTVNQGNSMTIESDKATIIDFFNSVQALDEEKQKKIIDFLNNEE